MADRTDHILNQINSIISGAKSPVQVKTEEGIYTPSYSFSPEETYALQAQGYSDRGDTAMADAYGNIANDLGRYSTFANTSLNTADSLLNYIQDNEVGLQRAAGNLYNQLTGDIQNQREYIYGMFGPNGQLTQEINRYYDDLGNYLATDAGRQAAAIAAQGAHSGASLGAIRAQQNEAYNQSFGRYIQAKEQEINAKQQIAANLINYMSTLRQEYGNTTNEYIINLYKRANDMYNTIAQSVAQDLNQYNQLRATSGLGGASSGAVATSLLSGTPTSDTTSTSSSTGASDNTGTYRVTDTNNNSTTSTGRVGKSFRRIIR